MKTYFIEYRDGRGCHWREEVKAPDRETAMRRFKRANPECTVRECWEKQCT